jgi:hypothetical protein
MDHHVPDPITSGLRRLGIDVLTAFEDRSHRLPDPTLLDRATALGRVLVSMDRDLLAEAARRQQSGASFSGLVYARQLHITVGQAIHSLEVICGVYDEDGIKNQVIYIPL